MNIAIIQISTQFKNLSFPRHAYQITRILPVIILFLSILTIMNCSSEQNENLVKSGDFATLDSWQQNETLKSFGKVTLILENKGVRIENPKDALDGTLYQDIPLSENTSYKVSMRLEYKAGDLSSASLALVGLDRKGKALQTIIPFQGITYYSGSSINDNYQKIISFMPGVRMVRLELSVIRGACTFGDIKLFKAEQPDKTEPAAGKTAIIQGEDFSVERFETDHPFWRIESDDLDGDGKPEVIACDVDHTISIRHSGEPPFSMFPIGSLVYSFAFADINGDAKKEIFITTVDPEEALKAYDLHGHVVLIIKDVLGHEKIEAEDMDKDGRPEIAAGIPGGLALFNNRGEKLWQVKSNYFEFHFGDLNSLAGSELIIGTSGKRTLFNVIDHNGQKISDIKLNDDRPINPRVFQIADINNDGVNEIIVYRRNQSLLAIHNGEILWQLDIPQGLSGDLGLTRTGDFCPECPGLETLLAGTHNLFLIDARGQMIYRSSDPDIQKSASFQPWDPRIIHPVEIAVWNPQKPELYLISSGFRDAAYYRLSFVKTGNGLTSYKVPDAEMHLDSIYHSIKERKSFDHKSQPKYKVIYVGNWGKTPEGDLDKLRNFINDLETPNLEYTLMYEVSDLKAHHRGTKMTIEEIGERATLLEKKGLPFGYFAVHGCQVWLSDEAIQKTIEAAPTMFRYLYVAENFELFYSEIYQDFLSWCERMLELGRKHNFKLVFKEKHDVWGVLPSDPDVQKRIFKPEYRDLIVPIYSTNQVYQPEVQWGGLLGLKQEGWCNEFGMSTQYWNYGEWGAYNRDEVQDLNTAFVCPADIQLRLELLGGALGGTWFHIEGGQQYLKRGSNTEIDPLTFRHREIVYELIRKNILTADESIANLNSTVVKRTLHPALAEAKQKTIRIMYPYFGRNTEELRKGFIAATNIFEPYQAYSFARLAYESDWNGYCFPKTPYGWVTILPPEANLKEKKQEIITDGELIFLDGTWQNAEKNAGRVKKLLQSGIPDIQIEAPGACVVARGPIDPGKKQYRVFLLDPKYLGPVGVHTELRVKGARLESVRDICSDMPLMIKGNSCPIDIDKGAFRVVDVVVGK